ncbi:MAG: gliding motility-associated C-terminal domain-containing protein, partial [Maribacter sp.]
NGETQVATDILLAWEEVPNAEGYLLSVGTSENTSDVLAVTDVGMLTEYVLPENLPEGRTIFVSIIAYNALGTSLDCQVQSFTTITQDDTQYGFSPNDDGINDFWTIDGIESVLDNTVQIYNRWGDLVFQIKGYDNASNVFSGTANMKTGMGADQLPSGTYFFNIQVSGEHQLKKLQGFLVLKR